MSDAADDGNGPEAAASVDTGAEGRGPWARFALTFGLLAIASEALYYGWILESAPFQHYLVVLAKTGTFILGWFDADVAVHGSRIHSGAFAVEIAQGCDAIEVCFLLAAAILAFPVEFRFKWRGLVFGIAMLQILNMVRIVTLFWIGALFPKVFRTSHEVVWPGILIVLTIVIWIGWVRWEDEASRRRENEA